jgi:predicted permease
MLTFLQDIRYAARQLVHNRTTSLIAILTLAIGIGANTSVLGLVNATLFKPVRSVSPGRLVWLAPKYGNASRYSSWSYADYRLVRDRAASYAGVIGFEEIPISLGGEKPERIRGIVASGNYFSVLAPRLAAGRGLALDDDGAPSARPVAVISHAFWQRRFGADTGVVGRKIILNGYPYTIIGIVAEGFNGTELGEPNDLWVPIAQQPQLAGHGNAAPDFTGLRVMALLKPDVTLERASAEARQIAAGLRADSVRAEDRLSVSVLPAIGGLDPANRAEFAPIMALIMIVPLLVLLVACANVANLFIGRALSRRKELAVRRAIGASRARLVRLLLTESVLLALAAGAAGIVLSSWMTALIGAIATIPPDVTLALTPDKRVFAVTAILAMAAGVLFGLIPAFTATSTSLTPALKNDGITVGRSRHRLRNAFVVAQASASLVLLITAGLLVRSLGKALDVPPGFDTRDAVAISFDLETQGYTIDATRVFQRRVLDDVRATSGVESAAIADILPLSNRMSGTQVMREEAQGERDRVTVRNARVSEGYFATMRIPIVVGREFSATDTPSGTQVAIVNETLARTLWPGQNAIGKRVREPWQGSPLREVVGVARDGKYEHLSEGPTNFYYVPTAQGGRLSDVTLVARTTGVGATPATQSLAAVFRALDPNVPLFRVTTLADNIRGTVDGQRAGATLLGVFGALALILAALGIYGVVSHGVTLRTREIGIRMSLGAQRGTVLAQFVREGLTLTLIGVGVGAAASVAVSGVLKTFLYGLAATDVVTFVLGALVLCVVALVASLVPARRAARVDPMVALRSE